MLLTMIGGRAESHPAHLESGTAILDELNNLERHVVQLRSRLERHWSLEGVVAVEVLQESHVAFWRQDYARSARLLLDLASRTGFEKHPAYAETMDLLGRSFHGLGFKKSGDRYRLQSLLANDQPKTAYRIRLAGFLTDLVIKIEPPVLHRLWNTFLRTSKPNFDDTQTQQMRYHIGRALYRNGDLVGSSRIFKQIEPGDVGHPRAQYFLGVHALHADDLSLAQQRFDAARESWLKAASGLEPQQPTSSSTKWDTSRDDAYEIGNAIHLGLARLAVARENYEVALQNYQKVPWFSSQQENLYTEVGFVLSKLNREDQVARLFRELQAILPAGLAREKARIRASVAAARGGDFDSAEDGFAALEKEAQRQQEALEKKLREINVGLLPSVSRWTMDDDGRSTERLSRSRIDAENEMVHLSRLQKRLAAQVAADVFLLPVAQEGQVFQASLTTRLKHLELHLRASSLGAKPSEPSSMHHPQHAEIRAGLTRVRRALNQFQQRLSAYKQNYESRIRKLLAEEGDALAQLEASQLKLTTDFRSLERLMRLGAASQLKDLALRAEYGALDIAYWRKEQVSTRIRDAQNGMEADLNSLEEAVRKNENMPVERMRSPLATVEPGNNRRWAGTSAAQRGALALATETPIE